MQDKRPYNKEGLAHGLWVKYYTNGNLWYRENWVNGVHDGPFESYTMNGDPICKCVKKNNEYVGYYARYDFPNDNKFYAK